MWARRETDGPAPTVMDRYIEFFTGYRHAYGVADFNHQDSYIDSETGKKKPVYRWNFEELTNEIYQQHLDDAHRLAHEYNAKIQQIFHSTLQR